MHKKVPKLPFLKHQVAVSTESIEKCQKIEVFSAFSAQNYPRTVETGAPDLASMSAKVVHGSAGGSAGGVRPDTGHFLKMVF